MHFYKSYGLTLQSEVALHEFPVSLPHEPDISIKISDKLALQPLSERGLSKERFNEKIIIHWQGIASYEISRGMSVTIYPCKNASNVMILQPLYGMVMATLLMQRTNNLVLHGSVVEYHGRAIIIIGRKGAGKSTLSSYLMHRGCKFVADDVAVIRFDYSSESVDVPPGVPHIRLWPSTIHFLGMDSSIMPSVNHSTEKKIYDVSKRCIDEAISLAGIITFTADESIKIVELTTLEKMKHLVAAQYFANSNEVLSKSEHEHILKHCACIARKELIVCVSRPMGLKHLSSVAEEVEKYFY